MKCSHCGKPIDDHTRFCPWCDHDNYPQMNRVQTKTTASAAKRHSQKTAGNNIPRPNVPNQPAQNKTNQNAAGCVVLIIVAVVLLMVFIGSLAASFSGI